MYLYFFDAELTTEFFFIFLLFWLTNKMLFLQSNKLKLKKSQIRHSIVF